MGLPGTVFQHGGYTFAKDLIFGWCLKDGDEWVPITDVSTKDLMAISRVFFPVYVPDAFRLEVVLEIGKRESKESSPPVAVKEIKPDESQVQVKAVEVDPRLTDRLKLTEEILEKMKPVSSLDVRTYDHPGIPSNYDLSDSEDLYSFLGYCLVSREFDVTGVWKVYSNKLILPQSTFFSMHYQKRSAREQSPFESESFATLHEAVTHIMKKWW